jgi:glycosyltransferase involved in cell wall biosynthesis
MNEPRGTGAGDLDDAARLFGVLVTYRRPDDLSLMLKRLAEQEVPLAGLVVVDNDPASEGAGIVRGCGDTRTRTEYLLAPENLGPAGGIALGMERVLPQASPDDWVLLLDDDDPPGWPSAFRELLAFGQEMRRADGRTGGVGLAGARMDWRRGRLVRPGDEELTGPVGIDYIGGNQLPLYLVAAARRVGTFAAPLFFGFDDLEYGLRLREAGYHLYAPGPLWLQQRERLGRTRLVVRPSLRLDDPTWRRYYSMRNTIHILRRFGNSRTAARVTVIQGLLKPAANLVRSPGSAWKHLQLNVAACRDGWMGRLGRTLEPQAKPAIQAPAERP